MTTTRHDRLKMAVRFYYDLKNLRAQADNRALCETGGLELVGQHGLSRPIPEVLQHLRVRIRGMEYDARHEVERWLKDTPIYESWLKRQPACDVAISGAIISEVAMCRKVDDAFYDIAEYGDEFEIQGQRYFRMRFTEKREKMDGEELTFERDLLCFHRTNKDTGDLEIWEDCCPTVSSLWTYCGLAVDSKTGKAVRRERGVRANWNPFLKAKMLGDIADNLLRYRSPWMKHYDNYRKRWEAQGKGASDDHRHNAAKRYMVKMFLIDLYKQWREIEGLPVAEEQVHHTGPQAAVVN